MLQSVLTNAAEAEIYGVEADIEFNPSEAFELGAAASYLHAEFTEFCTADPTQPMAAGHAAGAQAAEPHNQAGLHRCREPDQPGGLSPAARSALHR